MGRKRKCWSESFGTQGYRVRIFERAPGGPLWYEHRRPGRLEGSPLERASLRHRDRNAAKQWSLRRSDELRAGLEQGATGATLAHAVAVYLQFETPTKSRNSQDHDRRCAKMFARLFGARFDLHNLDSARWTRFQRDRLGGAIDAHGKPVKPADRKPVRPRTVRRDQEWFRTLIHWGMRWIEDGGPMVRSNPMTPLKLIEDANPRRMMAAHDRFQRLREVAPRITVQIRRKAWRRTMPSYLPELLDLADETGRRIGAIRQLRRGDIRVESTSQWPHGAILWPAATDKQGMTWLTPLTPDARAAIDRRFKTLTDANPNAYLFPSPSDPAKPVSKKLADTWMRTAEVLAGLEPLEGTCWHWVRRKWATERKNGSLRDVAAAGGWKDPRTLLTIYQQPDPETMYEVVTSPRRRKVQ